MKKYSFIFAIFCLLLGGCKKNAEINYEKASFQLLNGDLLTTMPGKLIVMDRYLVWEDPFSRDYFVHVHDKTSGDTIGSMGKVGEGPDEFITGGINFTCIDNCFFSTDANGNTKGYLSVDSLVLQKRTFIPLSVEEEAMRPVLWELEKNVFVGMTDNGVNDYLKANIYGTESTFGVYPIREVKQHLGGDKAYDAASGFYVCSSYDIPYLALYKKEQNSFKLQWEFHPNVKMYEVVDDKIIFDRKIKGIRGICMSKDYIVALQRDQSRDPMDESTVGRDASKCPRTVYLYDYDGRLVKIVDLGMPVMRIAADRRDNTLYAIGVNPDFSLVKYEL